MSSTSWLLTWFRCHLLIQVMAEAHQGVGFNFSITHEGVHVNYDTEVLGLVYQSGVRSYKKRFARFIVSIHHHWIFVSRSTSWSWSYMLDNSIYQTLSLFQSTHYQSHFEITCFWKLTILCFCFYFLSFRQPNIIIYNYINNMSSSHAYVWRINRTTLRMECIRHHWNFLVVSLLLWHPSSLAYKSIHPLGSLTGFTARSFFRECIINHLWFISRHTFKVQCSMYW